MHHLEQRDFDEIVHVAEIGQTLATWLGGKTEGTKRGYLADLRSFATWARAESPAAAAGRLLEGGPGEANRLVLGWRGALVEEGRAPATVNRRLATIRSFVDHAAQVGRIHWTLHVDGVPSRTYRDTRGPEWSRYLRSLRKASARDRAVLRLLGDRGLRRGEVILLDLSDVGEGAAAVLVRGKGRGGERERLTLAEPTSEALRAWIAERGHQPGPLFPGRGQGGRLAGETLRRLARRVVGSRPHGLRHAAITRALDRTGGDLRSVQRFARHARPETTTLYDDARRDLAGDVARKVADEPRRKRRGEVT